MLKSQEIIEAWLIEQLARLTGLDPQRIDVDRPLAGYGLDSIVSVELTADLEEWLGSPVPETLLWDAPTVRALAEALSGGSPGQAPEREQRPRAVPAPIVREHGLPDQPSSQRAGSTPGFTSEPIAVVGLACRVPGARNAEAFWQLLLAGTDATGELPADRWEGERAEAAAGSGGTSRGGFLEHIDLFDAQFFGISPREATHMDPQQRMLLEVAWEALEHAGQAPDELAGSQTGIFLGISTHDYDNVYVSDSTLIDAYTNTGNAHSIAASRLAYFLDLQGPCMAVDTACSSSLVSVHLACQSLRCGETSLALAGGVNIILSPAPTIGFSKARMISATGCCKPFDAEADGLLRGEGCGVVVLKRASDAYARGDRILALIRGSAVNQDGHSHGLTAPNGLAQQRVIKQALTLAGVAPGQLGYVVAQGTGTPLGDTVEFQALKDVLGERSGEERLCALGSIKANIGHLEAASGVASLIAAILALGHETIPPQVHFHQPHPHISLEQAPLYIPVEPVAWPRSDQARFAGVSAFSFSGTNVHLLLEEAPPVAAQTGDAPQPLYLLPLSASSEPALVDLLEACIDRLLKECSPDVLTDMCYTASVGRAHFDHRVAVLAETPQQLLAALQERHTRLKRALPSPGEAASRKAGSLAFLCSCEGAEYAHMGRELYETYPVFRNALNRCSILVERTVEQSLLSVLYPAPEMQSLLHEYRYRRVATFALDYALALLWRSWGVTPGVLAGYGVGVYVAACLAGALSVEDALILVTEQEQLWQQLPGDHSSSLEARLLLSHPSADHASALASFERVAGLLTYTPISIPFFCTTTGQYFPAGTRLDAEYWKRQLLGSMSFDQSIYALTSRGYTSFLELGPSDAVAQQGAALTSTEQHIWLPGLAKDRDSDWHSLLDAINVFYTSGFPLQWSAIYQNRPGRIISLPAYPFQRERYWISPVPVTRVRQATAGPSHPLLGQRIPQHQVM